MLRNNLNYYLVLSVILVFHSCNNTKDTVKIKPEKVKNIVEMLHNNELTFNTLFIKKLSLNFSDGQKSYNVKGYLKCIKDSMIIVSITPLLGIEMARIYFGKDSFIILNKLEKKSYYNSYQYFNNKFKVEFGLKDIQEVLLNSFLLIFNNYDGKYDGKAEFIHDNFVINLEQNLKIKLIVDPLDKKLLSTIIEDYENGIKLRINYLEYKLINNKKVPDKINLDLLFKQKKYFLKAQYSNIEIDRKVIDNFKNNITYKQVILK